MTEFVGTRLSDLSDVVSISRGIPTQATVADGELPVMSVADLRNGWPPRRFADQAALENTGIDTPRPGDVLVAIEGGTVGESYVVGENVASFIPSQQVAVLHVVDTSRLQPSYLGAWLTTEQAREQLRRLARGAGIRRIPMKELASLTIPVPSLPVQQEIGDRFLAFETAIQSHRAIAACLDELRALDLVVTFAHTGDAAPSTKS